MESKLEECIDVLNEVLTKFDILKESYSIGQYAEEAVCLEKNTVGWIVYEGERGKQYNIKIHPNGQEACLNLLSRLAMSGEEEKESRNYWKLIRRTEL